MRDFHLYCSAKVLFCFHKFHKSFWVLFQRVKCHSILWESQLVEILKICIWKDMRRQSLQKETKSDFNMLSKSSWEQSEQTQISFCLQAREENDSISGKNIFRYLQMTPQPETSKCIRFFSQEKVKQAKEKIIGN